jgi:hypothetical protein
VEEVKILILNLDLDLNQVKQKVIKKAMVKLMMVGLILIIKILLFLKIKSMIIEMK